ncbi:MAG: hypothetical protein HOB68_06345 [Candidatus Marinimicrobia bacterium]|jgi:hypothetical protein|nr:hypothetical protein [Candidatus Neomarinimicrobiota bacterium]MBT4685467.1 hypothetical protein [Candidatus Neomarinimicrobiota bacterium]
MSKEQKTHADPTLPHPDIQKTLLDMKAKGMLKPEILKKVSATFKTEFAIQKLLNEDPLLCREDAIEILEERKLGRPELLIRAITESVRNHSLLTRKGGWEFLDEMGY